MDERIHVETQGVSDDWSSASGDFTVRSRGMLKGDQLLSAMLHLAQLDTPDSADPCPPHVLTHGKAGDFSFIGQGGTIYCPETDQEITAPLACDLALGKAALAPPPPMPTSPRNAPAELAPAASRPRKRRKFGWRGGIVLFFSLCSLLGAVVMGFGVASMTRRGMPPDDIRAAIIIAGALGLICILLFALALKARRSHYVDNHGRRVAEDGSALPFVVMGQMLGGDDYDGDGYDGDDGGFDGGDD